MESTNQKLFTAYLVDIDGDSNLHASSHGMARHTVSLPDATIDSVAEWLGDFGPQVNTKLVGDLSAGASHCCYLYPPGEEDVQPVKRLTLVCVRQPVADFEPGAASILVSLRNGQIEVRHGGEDPVLLRKGFAPVGAWGRLFDLFEELGIESVESAES